VCVCVCARARVCLCVEVMVRKKVPLRTKICNGRG